jgi:hypothetical protein
VTTSSRCDPNRLGLKVFGLQDAQRRRLCDDLDRLNAHGHDAFDQTKDVAGVVVFCTPRARVVESA